MQLSDLISIIGILLAIIAFINQNERLFIWNKFGKKDKLLIITFFALVHYLLFYSWFLENMNFLKIFTKNNFPTTNNWAYFITICVMLWIIYKIFVADFPKENNKKVIEYYELLLNKKEYILLFNLIKKYNSKLLLNNTIKSKEFRLELINLIFGHKQFLENSALYNFNFFKSILKIQDIRDELLQNYIESQFFYKNSFFNNLGSDNYNLKQFVELLSKVQNPSNILNKSIKQLNLDIDLFLRLIFEYYKRDKKKSDIYLIKIWLRILKNNDLNSLKLYTKMLITFKFSVENFNKITEKITTNLTQIELQNNNDFISEVFNSYLNILSKCLDLNVEFPLNSLINITKNSNNKFPKKLYDFYYNQNKNKFKNLNTIINSIANE